MLKKIPEAIQTINENRANDPATLRAHLLNIENTAHEANRCAGMSASFLGDLEDLTADGPYKYRIMAARTAIEVQARIGSGVLETTLNQEEPVTVAIGDEHHSAHLEAVAFLDNLDTEIGRLSQVLQDMMEIQERLTEAYQSRRRP